MSTEEGERNKTTLCEKHNNKNSIKVPLPATNPINIEQYEFVRKQFKDSKWRGRSDAKIEFPTITNFTLS